MRISSYSALVAGILGAVSCAYASTPAVATNGGSLLAADAIPVPANWAGAVTLQSSGATVTPSSSLNCLSIEVPTMSLPAEISTALPLAPESYPARFWPQPSEPDWTRSFNENLSFSGSDYFPPIAPVPEKPTWIAAVLVSVVFAWRIRHRARQPLCR
jgi:hypothetical protein